MTELERDLRARLRTVELPPAPEALRRALRDIVLEPVAPRRASRRPLLLLGLAAVLAVGGAVAIGAALLHRADTITYADTFTVTGSMTTPRTGQTATLLADGKVLIAGGASDQTTVLSSAELYDPASGTFAATGSMGTARFNATATLLPDGRVLIVDGAVRLPGFFGTPTTTELYDPVTGTFSATGSMTTARDHAPATLLPDGRVLFLGGEAGNPSMPLSTAEVYDPVTGTFSATGSMTTARDLTAVALLPDGRVLVAGGELVSGDQEGGFSVTATDVAELYDPQTGTFTPTGSLAVARISASATLLPDGSVLVVGGSGDAPGGLASAEIYDPASGTFSATGSLDTPRVLPDLMPLRDGRVLVVGGAWPPAGAELYDPETGTFTPAGPSVVLRAQCTATLLRDGRALVVGGYGSSPRDFLASAELFH